MQSDAKQIIADSIAAVLPDAAVRRALKGRVFPHGAVLVAIGKAAWRMAHAACDVLDGQVKKGVVITKYGHSEGPIDGLLIIEAGHPVPDKNSVLGAERALELVLGLTEEDTVVFLVSGGGSALFEKPLEGCSLDDLAGITGQLLACGAEITEINTIRKHLSAVKGGRFGQACAPARVLSVILSDVLGDPLDAIASGPAVPDRSSSADAAKIVAKYGLDMPPHILKLLEKETPKALKGVESVVTGNVNELCEAAARSAAALGYTPLLLTTTMNGEAREMGRMLASIAQEIRRSGRPAKPPCAVIAGGETIVHVRGKGKGGRNQELALAAAEGLDGLPHVCLFSLGSDGTDGPTDAAGGMVTGEFARACRAHGLSIHEALESNDAYPLLEQMDALIRTGPTGTNVNDVAVLLIK